MKNFNEIRDLAQKYIDTKKHQETILWDPIFRLENNKLCLMYAIVEFCDEEKLDYRIKRPTEWFIQDIESGEILEYYDVHEKDFTTIEEVPLNSLFSNTGKSIVYNYNVFVVESFRKWVQEVKEDLKKKIANTTYKLDQEKVMQVSDEVISPRDYVLANLDASLEKMHNIVFYDLGDAIRDAYSLYYGSLFASIRKKYLEEKLIDKELIKKYLNLIKYLWPESYIVINNMTNINGVIDQDFDEKIEEMLKNK